MSRPALTRPETPRVIVTGTASPGVDVVRATLAAVWDPDTILDLTIDERTPGPCAHCGDCWRHWGGTVEIHPMTGSDPTAEAAMWAAALLTTPGVRGVLVFGNLATAILASLAELTGIPVRTIHD